MTPAAFARGDHVELARALVKSLDRHVEPVSIVGDLGAIHAYEPERGIWNAVDGTEQSRIVQSFANLPAGDKCKPLRISVGDVSGAMRLAFDQVAQPGYFAAAPVGIALWTEFVRVDANGLSFAPHSPENRCRFGYDFDLPDAPSDAWAGFLRALFRDDADGADKIMCLGEFFGASALGLAPKYQQAVVASGGGDNGKSTLAKIVTAAMPLNAVCAIAPQDMGQEYRRAMLAGKRLNVVNELPEATIIASEAFKAIVVGDPITGRHIREAPFTFSPEAGHYFAANRLPGTNDQTEGFWRRLIVIEFNRSFKGDPERDPSIADTIIREHLPGVVRWMLEGAARLLQQGRYTLPSSHKRALAEWKLSSDQVAMFLHERGTLDPTASTPATRLYEAYRQWALTSGHRNLMAKNSFGARLRLLEVEPRHTRDGVVYPVMLKQQGLT
jgi:putative DNA primase/helicase